MVRGDVALPFLSPAPPPPPPGIEGETSGPEPTPSGGLKRFHGSIELDPQRPIPAFSTVAEEVIAQLAGQPGVDVRVRVDIEARSAEVFPDGIVRTVTENARTLKFSEVGFEED